MGMWPVAEPPNFLPKGNTVKDAKRKEIIDLLITAYNMEIETVINYLANGHWLDGIHAQQIKNSLAADVGEELGHATLLVKRIKILGGRPPGSQELKWTQKVMQPPKDPLSIVGVIKGVIAAEEGAIEHYQKLIEATDGVDMVTQDLCITLKGDEEEHRQLFAGFLSEAKSMGLAGA